jgi:hypothetical protein
MLSGVVIVAESGRRMVQGACPVCTTRMNKIID